MAESKEIREVYSTAILLNTATIREVNSTEIDINLRREKHRITRHYSGKLQTTKQSLTTSKHSVDKLALASRRWMCKKDKRLTITANCKERNLGSEEKNPALGPYRKKLDRSRAYY